MSQNRFFLWIDFCGDIDYDNGMFRSNVKRMMEARGISFRELAKLAGVGPNQIHLAREGEFQRLNFATLEKIARALGTGYCDLFEEFEDEG